jgi:hypothetical protein
MPLIPSWRVGGCRTGATATGEQSSPSLLTAIVEIVRKMRGKCKQCRSADILVRQTAWKELADKNVCAPAVAAWRCCAFALFPHGPA